MASPSVTRLDQLRMRPVVSVARDVPLGQAARVMRAHDISALVVGEHGEPVAIVTERDLTQALADGRAPDEPVGEIATGDPRTIDHRATVTEAASRMLRDGHRHLIVTEGQRVVGVVSGRDLLAELVTAATTGAIFVRVERVVVDPPELWLG